MGKYQENWKYRKFKKCEIGKMGNVENVKEDNKNQRGSIVRKGCKNPKGYIME